MMLEKVEVNVYNHNEIDCVLAVLLSTALWRSSYATFRYFLPKKGPEYCCRIISFIHAVLAAGLGCSQCSWKDPPFKHPEWPNSDLQTIVLTTSLGYFIHDLAWCLKYQAEDKLMIAHHLYGIWVPSRFLFRGYAGAMASCTLGGLEFSNPLLQIRWFIRTEGMYPSLLFTVIETLFLIAFAMIRILIGTYYLIITLEYASEEWDIIIFGGTIQVISFLFFAQIVKYWMEKYVWIRKKKSIENIINLKKFCNK